MIKHPMTMQICLDLSYRDKDKLTEIFENMVPIVK